MIWLPIEGYPGYEVSEAGVIRSERRPNGMKPRSNGKGYYIVTLHNEYGMATKLISRIVLETFVGPAPSEHHQAAHGNGNKADNSLLNLRWATQVENEEDKEKHGTRPRGEKHANSCGLTDEQVKEIKALIPWPHGFGRVLAKRYGVSDYVIHSIKTGLRRK